MTITIDNLTINNNASAGTVIGVLTGRDAAGNVIPCNYRLTKGASGYFVISDNKLVTAWSLPITTGYYSVRVHAIGITAEFGGSAPLGCFSDCTSEEHTSELQSHLNLVCPLLLGKQTVTSALRTLLAP